MADNFKFFQTQPYALAGAGVSAGGVTMTLNSFLDIDGNVVTMASTFGQIGFGTVEPGSKDREEQICFTGITNNGNGTSTITGISSVLFSYPYTQTSGFTKSHPGGVTFVISNTSGFYNELTSKDDDETINGTWSFTAVPNAPAPVSGTDVANKDYVLSVVNGGPITTDKVTISGVAGETIVQGNLIYLKASDGKWYKTDADTASTVNAVELGVAQGAGATGFAITNGVLVKGLDATNTGLTPGSTYFASNTAGAISISAGTNSRKIGLGDSTGKLIFDPYFADIPTDDQKAALVGSSGTPSATNKYLTQADTTYSPSGIMVPFPGRTTPTGWLLCDGSAVSRATYATLFSTIAPSQVFTVTLASPAVFSATSHGLTAGDKISLTTTGALPTGLATNTDYYVIATGLTTNAFEVSATRGGAAVNTSGSQSGVQTLYATNFGKGDGSTTFNVPDMQGFIPYGYKSTDANFDVLNVPNTYVGEKTHLLITNELATHNHTLKTPAGGGGATLSVATTTSASPASTSGLIGDTGQNVAHNNMPPYIVTRYIIKI